MTFFSNALCRVKEYVKSELDHMVIDPDPDDIHIRREKKIMNSSLSSSANIKYPSDGWEISRKDSFIHSHRNEPTYCEFGGKNCEHPITFQPNKF